MQTYIVKRLLLAIPTLLIVSLIIFTIVRLLPGDALDAVLSDIVDRSAAGGTKEQIRHELGLDRPFFQQYLTFLGGILQGDLSNSLFDGSSVMSHIKPRILVTVELALLTIFFSIIIAIPIGILSAIRQDTLMDYFLRSMAILGLAVPNFWLGVMVVVLPALWFGWTPPVVYTHATEHFGRHILQFLLPAFILGVFFSASVMRMTRAMMLEVLRQDYIRTAWSKGLRERVVVVRHATKNALIPVVTVLGQEVAFLVGGAVVIESIFGLPGLGRLLLDNIEFRDYPIVQGIVLLMAFAIVIINLVIDLSYAWLDPRIRYS